MSRSGWVGARDDSRGASGTLETWTTKEASLDGREVRTCPTEEGRKGRKSRVEVHNRGDSPEWGFRERFS